MNFKKEKSVFSTFEKSICWWRGKLFVRQFGSIHNTGDDDEQTGDHCGYQGSNSNGPEVFGSSHPGQWGETPCHDDHPDTEGEFEPGSKKQGLQELGDEDNEYTASSVECEGDADDRDDPAQLAGCLLSNSGVGVPHLTPELFVPLLQHDPAQTQPGPGVARVDWEEDDECEAGDATSGEEGAG